uniref:Uncharacterized protein n=1 Tax=Anguilla anguilla TaxID=7936 RepID=A0A0E9VHB5_ANGAN
MLYLFLILLLLIKRECFLFYYVKCYRLSCVFRCFVYMECFLALAR